MTTTYRTAGTTDDVTTCDICGREELRGTVRLEIVDSLGRVEGEIFAGTSCASTIAGRSAAIVAREARDADQASANAVREAAHRQAFDAEQELLDSLGLERNFRNVKHVRSLMKAAA
jgi:hypothetical protein